MWDTTGFNSASEVARGNEKHLPLLRFQDLVLAWSWRGRPLQDVYIDIYAYKRSSVRSCLRKTRPNGNYRQKFCWPIARILRGFSNVQGLAFNSAYILRNSHWMNHTTRCTALRYFFRKRTDVRSAETAIGANNIFRTVSSLARGCYYLGN